MPLQASPQIVDTVGIEFETEYISPDYIGGFRKGNTGGWHHTHDASIESPRYSIDNKRFIIENSKWLNYFPYNNITLGSEIVSGILDTGSEEFFPNLKNLLLYIQEGGESPNSYRAGIHVHVTMSTPNLKILRNLLRLGAFFEPLFFNIGGMGYNFRGIYNDSIYCRPITSPCWIRYGERFAKVFKLEDLIVTSKSTTEEFWKIYGDISNHDTRYNPVRYHWLNLFPMYPSRNGNYRGTVEFRVFNKTLNPYYLYAIVKMCQYFAKLSMLMSLQIIREEKINKINSIVESHSSDDLLELLAIFRSLTEADSFVIKEVESILRATPIVKLSDKKILSHLYGRNMINGYWNDGIYTPPEIEFSVENPTFIDSHNFREFKSTEIY
jgi:hypothetical protein